MTPKKVIFLNQANLSTDVIYENLKVYTNLEIIPFYGISETFNYLNQHHTNINYIITKDNIEDIDSSRQVESFLKKNNFNIPCLVLGMHKSSSDLITSLKEPYTVKDIIVSIAKELSITPEEMVKVAVPTYYPYPRNFLQSGLKLVTSIFQSEKSNHRQLFKKDHIITDKDIEMLQKKNIKMIYVDSLDRLAFINKATDIILNKERNDSLNPEHRFIKSSAAFEYVHTIAKDIGIDQKSIAISHECIDSMQTIVDETASLSSLLNEMMNNKLAYKFRRSVLVNYLCSYLVNTLDYGTKEQIKILSYAAFFHDSYVKHDEWVDISSEKDLNQLAHITEQELEGLVTHAQNAAGVIAQYTSIPLGVSDIIKKHHGADNGIGFKLNHTSLSHLDIVFISADRWASEILKAKKESRAIRPKEIFITLDYLYKVNKFKKAIKALSVLEIN